jgi:segregation and condensation protein A
VSATAPAEVKELSNSDDHRTLSQFTVHLPVFEGPFEVLLSLISKHRLDVTTVALSVVTDEFLAFTTAHGRIWDLGQATEFLVVAATLLDLKVARLLPGDPVEDAEDLALLEARDLLFARLLQYRAYKQASRLFGGLLLVESSYTPRTAGPEPHHLALLPEVVLTISPGDLADLAARAMVPKPQPEISTTHVHAPRVNVREQMAIVVGRLGEAGSLSFRDLCADCAGLHEVVGRFLAALELFREGQVAFDQVEALGELHVRRAAGAPAWSGGTAITSDVDEAPESPPASAAVESAPDHGTLDA